MNPLLDSALLHRLREARRAEFERGLPQAAPTGMERDEHRSSLTQVHDDVRAVLVRIDAAEAAMRPVLRLWASDPARGGAHLLEPDDPGLQAASDVELPQPTTPWSTLAIDESLPDTVRPDSQSAS